MIRVLFVSHDSMMYGAQQSLLALVSGLDRRQFEARVITPYVGPLNQALESLGIPVVTRSMSHWIASGSDGDKGRVAIALKFARGLKARVWAIAKQIESNNIDVVYTNTVTVLEGALAAQSTGRPHIWHLREQAAGNSQLLPIPPKRLIPYIVGYFSSDVIVNSRHLRSVYERGTIAKKMHTVYNGVDLQEFAIDKQVASASFKKELGLCQSARLVSTLGSIIPRKNQALFVQAAELILQRIPDAHFVIAGEGDPEYIAKVRKFCTDRNISDRVHLVGWRRDVAHVLAASDVLVVTADEEPFGRTIIEAMATSTPAVSTRCGGPEEIIEDGVSGRLVPRGDHAALANTLIHLLADANELHRLAIGSRRRVESSFTLAAHTLQVQSIITRAMHCSGAPPLPG